MRRPYQVASLVFLAVAIYTIVEGRSLDYYGLNGPGPGFFPFWLGLLLGIFSLAWFGQATFQPVKPMPEDFVPARDGATKIISVIVSLVVAALAVDTLGFQVVAFCFMMFLLWIVGRQNLILALVLSLVGSVGVYYVFKTYLDVHLPAAAIEFLHNLGL